MPAKPAMAAALHTSVCCSVNLDLTTPGQLAIHGQRIARILQVCKLHKRTLCAPSVSMVQQTDGLHLRDRGSFLHHSFTREPCHTVFTFKG
jgi:hypothetical protein